MWFARRIYFQNFGLAKLKYIQQEGSASTLLFRNYFGACRKHQTASHGQNSKGTVMEHLHNLKAIFSRILIMFQYAAKDGFSFRTLVLIYFFLNLGPRQSIFNFRYPFFSIDYGAFFKI
jgi:hypothetical protein